MRSQIYKCPSCGALKTIVLKDGSKAQFSKKVYCGYIGCADYAVPHTK